MLTLSNYDDLAVHPVNRKETWFIFAQKQLSVYINSQLRGSFAEQRSDACPSGYDSKGLLKAIERIDAAWL